MSFIGADCFSIGYPRLILNQKGVVRSYALREKDIVVVGKYIDRGYDLRDTVEIRPNRMVV